MMKTIIHLTITLAQVFISKIKSHVNDHNIWYLNKKLNVLPGFYYQHIDYSKYDPLEAMRGSLDQKNIL